ncbi:MAG: methionine synthase [Bacteroidales bacterium]|nr:methionine synthase [Bacteroidales bacterium]
MSITKDIEERILLLDGAMGTMIQRHELTEEDYHALQFADCRKELKGNNECLNLTRPEIIRSIHEEYIAAGADIIETNTFSANRISQAEYDCEAFAAQMAYEGARIAREAADEACRIAEKIGLKRKVWVAGSMGPTSKSLSLSPDVSDPAFRPYSFDDMKEAYQEQAEALIRGGVDLILIETCFDALNVKAALAALQEVSPDQIPVIVSVSVGDRSGRTLTGQTLEAFYTSVCHYPLLAFGLNCSLGATEMTPLLEDVGNWCGCAISCYPNAGLPNEMGGYDQTPEEMADAVRGMAEKGLLNIIGGCCGTTPDHIRAIASAVREARPHKIADKASTTGSILKVSGLDSVTIDVRHNNFTNVGERTNVAGSRKFARLISEGRYDEGLQIAARQIEDGASIIDINMDDAMLDSTKEMERFVRHISNDPAVARAALMIDSSHWETISAGLKNAQGKCIVNSISLKEGEESFIEKARSIKALGAAMVVMAFDEKGQATTYNRKIEICSRAYNLLTQKAGISPEDIIFDANILSIGTGIEEHARYAVDFIEAVRWIKKNLPGALTSGGVSNLSFAFRGNNAVREAMHSAFLFHAIEAGLDMAIVNPSMLQVYDEIDPSLLECIEDVIFDRDPQATERLIAKASEMLTAAKAEVREEAARGDSAPATVRERLKSALVKGVSSGLSEDLKEAMEEAGSAVAVIEGPLMEGMETVGRLFGEGKMFLPQVVKSAKVMRDAVELLNPYMETNSDEVSMNKPKIVMATVKGDVHDIGKNITGIVMTCNGFDVHDLGVMVDKEVILAEAEAVNADIIGVSGLITPSLFQMEELCREMARKGMTTPLLIGGATTSALHTAVKLAPLYDHVFYGADASAAAVMAKRYISDPEGFENEQHSEQERLRDIYNNAGKKNSDESPVNADRSALSHEASLPCPEDIPVMEIPATEIIPFFDWKMFYAIWGVRYGSAVPEAMELMQLRRDAEDELETGNFRIMISARFFMGQAVNDSICFDDAGKTVSIPFMRQDKGLSLSDFVAPESSGSKSPFGAFAISVHTLSETHEEGCCCPACSNRYEDLIGKTVRMTLAEAASCWLDRKISDETEGKAPLKIIKPAAGYASCPDHTLKGDILSLLGEHVHPHDCHDSHCSCHSKEGLGISLTESYAMTPEASICGFIFMHPEAKYPDIRRISRKQFEEYAQRRGMTKDQAERFLGHLL